MTAILKLPFLLLSTIFGRLSWSSPPWLMSLHRKRKDKPAVFWIITILAFLLIIALWQGYQYYQNLPQPIQVVANITPPQPTATDENAKPDKLTLEFNYENDASLRASSLSTTELSSPSVAALNLMGKVLRTGVSLSPKIAGEWRWQNDRVLVFTPATDWPAGVEYTVRTRSSIFANNVPLASNTFSFTTPFLSFEVNKFQFYQDPRDPKIRRVISTFAFSHPVNKDTLASNIRLALYDATDENKVDKASSGTSFPFQLRYSDNMREAYLQSDPVSLPDNNSVMELTIDKGVTSVLGGQDSKQTIVKNVLIPNINSFLKVAQTSVSIVKNEEEVPEQVISISFTDDIDKSALLNKLSVYLLPKKGEPNGKAYWKSPSQVDTRLLSEPVDIKLIDNSRSFSKHYHLVIDVPEGRQLYLRLEPNLRSINHYKYPHFFDQILASPTYPKELKVMGKGSVITHSSEHKISVLARGLKAARYSIARIPQEQLNHLISQTDGDISSPVFSSWRFNAENLGQFEHKIVNLAKSHPKDASFFTIDLANALRKQKDAMGLFLVEIKGWNEAGNYEVYGVSETRLILISDLGVIVKRNNDLSQDVFVQSIVNATPVNDAQVQLLGKNGQALFSRHTDERGHVSLPSTQQYNNEQAPTVYLIQKGNDVSFIPFDRYSRQINFSRFDIGGEFTSPNEQNDLKAFMFSDRGIYRPGETVNIANIVKHTNLSSVDDGVPIELVIRGPRGNEVVVEKMLLNASGFFDYAFTTSATSDTGLYYANLRLAKTDNSYQRTIGNFTFSIEEFQPDSMKITSRLQSSAGEPLLNKGWIKAPSIHAQISLQNLFGIPAQHRRISATVSMTRTSFYFEPFSDYTFAHFLSVHDNGPSKLAGEQTLAPMVSNDNGQAKFDIDLSNYSQGAYRLNFTSTGYEDGGGRSVSANNRALVSAANELVGYKADGDLSFLHIQSQRNINFIAINNNLEKVHASALTLSLLTRNNVSTLVQLDDGNYEYQSIEKIELLTKNPFSISSSGYQHIVDTAQPGNFRLVIENDKGITLASIDYTVVGNRNIEAKLDKNAELQLTLNKSDYRAGESIELSITAPYVGSGLISIEGQKVHHFKWFKASTKSSLHRIILPEGIEGTAYINVAFVRDVNAPEIFTSPLSYAVVPFSIDRSKRNIDVDLVVPDRVTPGDTLSIKYKTDTKADIVIFAIDEGILQVANYQLPNPLAYFLKKKALSVSTLQVLDLIMPDFKLLQKNSASGGDMMMSKEMESRSMLASNINPFSRKVDTPAVYWSGILVADSNQKTTEFTVPDTFSGSMRVMAVAVNNKGIGAEQANTLVRGPFVLSPNVLTQATPGDEFNISLGVANLVEGSGNNANIDIQVSTNKNLAIVGDAKLSLSISEEKEGLATFMVKVLDTLGEGKLYFDVSYTDKRNITHSALRTASMSIRPSRPFEQFVDIGVSQNSISLPIEHTLYPQFSTQRLSVSASPLVLTDALTQYLAEYPHECTEQIVSQVFPLIGLSQHPAYANSKDIKAHFDALINSLRERQLADGGFVFWPGQSQSAVYPSLYVMHFLIDAKSLGFAVPSDMLSRGQRFLHNQAQQTSQLASLQQARERSFAIYLLTRNGQVTTNYAVALVTAMSKAFKQEWQSDIAGAYIAASYQLMQQKRLAKELITSFTMLDYASAGQPSDDTLFADFESPLAFNAQYVYLVSKHFPELHQRLSGKQIASLTQGVFTERFNTLSAAYTTLALGAYTEQLATSGSYSFIADEVSQLTLLRTSVAGRKSQIAATASPFPTAVYNENTALVAVESTNDAELFYANFQSGFVKSNDRKERKQGIEVYREFTDEKGNEVNAYTQGKVLNIELKVRTLGHKTLTNIALTDLLPGGFEVVRSSLNQYLGANRSGVNTNVNENKRLSQISPIRQIEHIDIREDRVVFYGQFNERVTTLRYQVIPVASGTFHVPATTAEAMYNRHIKAMTAPNTITIKPQ